MRMRRGKGRKRKVAGSLSPPLCPLRFAGGLLRQAKRIPGEADPGETNPWRSELGEAGDVQHARWTLRACTSRYANLYVGLCEPTQRGLQPVRWVFKLTSQDGFNKASGRPRMDPAILMDSDDGATGPPRRSKR